MEEMEPGVSFVLIYSFNKDRVCGSPYPLGPTDRYLWVLNDSTIQLMYRAHESMGQWCGRREGWHRILPQDLWMMGMKKNQKIATSTSHVWALLMCRKVQAAAAESAQPTCLDWNQSSALDPSWKYACWRDEMGRSTHSTYDSVSVSDVKPSTLSKAKRVGWGFALFLSEGALPKGSRAGWHAEEWGCGCRQWKIQDALLQQWPLLPQVAAAIGYFKAQNDIICYAAKQGRFDSCLNSTHTRGFSGGLQRDKSMLN